jgi:hypothetical protein
MTRSRARHCHLSPVPSRNFNSHGVQRFDLTTLPIAETGWKQAQEYQSEQGSTRLTALFVRLDRQYPLHIDEEFDQKEG